MTIRIPHQYEHSTYPSHALGAADGGRITRSDKCHARADHVHDWSRGLSLRAGLHVQQHAVTDCLPRAGGRLPVRTCRGFGSGSFHHRLRGGYLLPHAHRRRAVALLPQQLGAAYSPARVERFNAPRRRNFRAQHHVACKLSDAAPSHSVFGESSMGIKAMIAALRAPEQSVSQPLRHVVATRAESRAAAAAYREKHEQLRREVTETRLVDAVSRALAPKAGRG